MEQTTRLSRAFGARSIGAALCSAALLALALGANTASANDPPPPDCTTATLYAGQDQPVGLVTACPGSDSITFSTTAGYCFSEVHLAYGEWDPDITSYLNKDNAPRIGKFPLQATPGCAASHVFDNLEPHLKAGDFVAAHAVVVADGSNINIDYEYEETAWAASPDGNNRQFNHKSWATYFRVAETPLAPEVIDPLPEEVKVDYVDITVEADAKCAQCAGLNCLLRGGAAVERCPSADVNWVNGVPSGRAPNVCYTFVQDLSAGRNIIKGCAVAQDLRLAQFSGDNDYTLVFPSNASFPTYGMLVGRANRPDCASVETGTTAEYGCVFVCDGTKDSSGCNRPPQLLPVSQDITNTVNGGAIAIPGYVAPNPAP